MECLRNFESRRGPAGLWQYWVLQEIPGIVAGLKPWAADTADTALKPLIEKADPSPWWKLNVT